MHGIDQMRLPRTFRTFNYNQEGTEFLFCLIILLTKFFDFHFLILYNGILINLKNTYENLLAGQMMCMICFWVFNFVFDERSASVIMTDKLIVEVQARLK